MTTNVLLQERATALKLYGMLAHWDEICDLPWCANLLNWEEEEHARRSLERRLGSAHIGRFKPLADFDWQWPKQCDREAIEELMQLTFLAEHSNVIFCGPNGVGKSMIARNIAHQAVIRGFTVLFVTAGKMLTDLATLDGATALRRKLKYFAQPHVLIIDEIGSLSYSNRYADLLFEIISARYQEKSTLITTNKPFAEWGEIFPNASSVVSLIDRLVHHSEIISIDAESYRFKEAMEKNKERKIARDKKKKKAMTTDDISKEEKNNAARS